MQGFGIQSKVPQYFVSVWMCRWSAPSGLVMVRHWSRSFCSSSDVLPFSFWLPGVLRAVWSYWRLSPGCSLPRHLHRPPGSVNLFLFLWSFSVGNEDTARRTKTEAKFKSMLRRVFIEQKSNELNRNRCLITYNPPGKGNRFCPVIWLWDLFTLISNKSCKCISQYLHL